MTDVQNTFDPLPTRRYFASANPVINPASSDQGTISPGRKASKMCALLIDVCFRLTRQESPQPGVGAREESVSGLYEANFALFR